MFGHCRDAAHIRFAHYFPEAARIVSISSKKMLSPCVAATRAPSRSWTARSTTGAVGNVRQSEFHSSASSRLTYWVQSLEFSPRVVDFELPVHAALLGVGFLCPGSYLGLKNVEFAEATSAQALAGQATQFALGDV